MEAPALIVVDMLNDLLHGFAPARKQRLIEATNARVGLMRRHRLPVIRIRQDVDPDLRDAFPAMRKKGVRIAITGTPGCEVAPQLAAEASDAAIDKKRYSAFFGTVLEEMLEILSPMDSFSPASTSTPISDFQIVVASDCIVSCDHEHHDIWLRYMNGKIASVISNDDIRAMVA
jgi:maleamate amidohydrolase